MSRKTTLKEFLKGKALLNYVSGSYQGHFENSFKVNRIFCASLNKDFNGFAITSVRYAFTNTVRPILGTFFLSTFFTSELNMDKVYIKKID